MKYATILLLVFSAFVARAQKTVYKGFPSLIWPKLYDITFEKGRDELGEYERPVFTQAVQSLAGKTVILPGYMVPIEDASGSSSVMLSSLPLNACFFCGVGGPETVVEVKLREKTRWIEQPIEVKGVLRLNDRDPDQMIYLLEDAEIIRTLDF